MPGSETERIGALLEIMATLRTPDTGCPWDLVQTFESIVPFTIEEAYEVADAVERGDMDDLKDELGDLLLQVVFHARMAEEQGSFTFDDVVDAISRKMVRRHPHIFAERSARSPAEVKVSWAEIKRAERDARAERLGHRPERLLDAIPANLPALVRAVKLQEKASSVGFDWNDALLVLAKIREEADEVQVALDERDAAAIKDEIGDLLFAVANLARHAGVDPEAALRGGNAKFERRFGHIEAELGARGLALKDAGLDTMERLWQEAKATERNRG